MTAAVRTDPQPVVTVEMKYLVHLKEQTGCSSERLEFPMGSLLRDVVEYLKKRYGIVLPDPRIVMLLNGRGWAQLSGELDTRINTGDTITLFPMLSGG